MAKITSRTEVPQAEGLRDSLKQVETQLEQMRVVSPELRREAARIADAILDLKKELESKGTKKIPSSDRERFWKEIQGLDERVKGIIEHAKRLDRERETLETAGAEQHQPQQDPAVAEVPPQHPWLQTEEPTAPEPLPADVQPAPPAHPASEPLVAPELPSKPKIDVKTRVDAIVESFLSYGDAELSEEVKQQSLESNKNNPQAKKYAGALAEIMNAHGEPEIQKKAQEMLTQCVDRLHSLGITNVSPYTKSQSWALWDLGKQQYFFTHANEADPRYTIGDPLSPEKQKEIVDRHVGWEAYHNFRLNNQSFINIVNAHHKVREIWAILNKPPKDNGELSSFDLAALGTLLAEQAPKPASPVAGSPKVESAPMAPPAPSVDTSNLSHLQDPSLLHDNFLTPVSMPSSEQASMIDTHPSAPLREAVRSEKVILDISEREIAGLVGPDRMKIIMNRLCDPATAKDAGLEFQHLFADASVDKTALAALAERHGYTAEEFLHMWSERLYAPILEAIEKWIEQVSNNQINAGIDWKDRVKAGWWQKTKQYARTAVPVMVGVAGVAAVVATAGAAGVAAGAAAGAGSGLLKRFLKKGEGAKEAIKKSEDAYKTNLEEIKARKKESREGLAALQADFASRDAMEFFSFMSQGLRDSSGAALGVSEEANAHIIRTHGLEMIKTEKEARVAAGDASAEAAEAAHTAELDHLLAKLYTNGMSDRSRIAELAEKNPLFLAAIKKVMEIQSGGPAEEHTEKWKEALAYVASAAAGAGIGAGIAMDSAWRMLPGALAGGYIGAMKGREKDREAQMKIFVQEVEDRTQHAEDWCRFYEDPGADNTLRTASDADIIELQSKLRTSLQMGMLDRRLDLQYRVKNVLRRIDRIQLQEAARAPKMESLLGTLRKNTDAIKEEKRDTVEKLEKRTAWRTVAYGVAGAAAGAAAAFGIGEGVKVLRHELLGTNTGVKVGAVEGVASAKEAGVVIDKTPHPVRQFAPREALPNDANQTTQPPDATPGKARFGSQTPGGPPAEVYYVGKEEGLSHAIFEDKMRNRSHISDYLLEHKGEGEDIDKMQKILDGKKGDVSKLSETDIRKISGLMAKHDFGAIDDKGNTIWGVKEANKVGVYFDEVTKTNIRGQPALAEIDTPAHASGEPITRSPDADDLYKTNIKAGAGVPRHIDADIARSGAGKPLPHRQTGAEAPAAVGAKSGGGGGGNAEPRPERSYVAGAKRFAAGTSVIELQYKKGGGVELRGLGAESEGGRMTNTEKQMRLFGASAAPESAKQWLLKEGSPLDDGMRLSDIAYLSQARDSLLAQGGRHADVAALNQILQKEILAVGGAVHGYHGMPEEVFNPALLRSVGLEPIKPDAHYLRQFDAPVAYSDKALADTMAEDDTYSTNEQKALFNLNRYYQQLGAAYGENGEGLRIMASSSGITDERADQIVQSTLAAHRKAIAALHEGIAQGKPYSELVASFNATARAEVHGLPKSPDALLADSSRNADKLLQFKLGHLQNSMKIVGDSTPGAALPPEFRQGDITARTGLSGGGDEMTRVNIPKKASVSPIESAPSSEKIAVPEPKAPAPESAKAAETTGEWVQASRPSRIEMGKNSLVENHRVARDRDGIPYTGYSDAAGKTFWLKEDDWTVYNGRTGAAVGQLEFAESGKQTFVANVPDKPIAAAEPKIDLAELAVKSTDAVVDNGHNNFEANHVIVQFVSKGGKLSVDWMTPAQVDGKDYVMPEGELKDRLFHGKDAGVFANAESGDKKHLVNIALLDSVRDAMLAAGKQAEAEALGEKMKEEIIKIRQFMGPNGLTEELLSDKIVKAAGMEGYKKTLNLDDDTVASR